MALKPVSGIFFMCLDLSFFKQTYSFILEKKNHPCDGAWSQLNKDLQLIKHVWRSDILELIPNHKLNILREDSSIINKSDD